MQGYRGSTVLLNNMILFYITDIVIKYYYGGSLSSHFDWASVSCCDDDSSRLAGVSPQELFQFAMHFIVSHFPTLISIMAVSLFPDLINSVAPKEPINALNLAMCKVRQTFLTRI